MNFCPLYDSKHPLASVLLQVKYVLIFNTNNIIPPAAPSWASEGLLTYMAGVL